MSSPSECQLSNCKALDERDWRLHDNVISVASSPIILRWFNSADRGPRWTKQTARFNFAPPDSWGVLDYPGPSWEQSYQKMLDEMVIAGYTGTQLVHTASCLPIPRSWRVNSLPGS